jgi:pimeloyl-ACP methyl ester carboxylesterase
VPRALRTGAAEPRRRWRTVLAAIAAALAILIAVTAAVPPFRARAKAAAVLASAIGAPFPRPFARRVSVRTVTPSPGLVGDLYSSGRAPPIVLSPGAAPEGKDDPRMVRLARALAGAHRVVFVPQLDLRHQRFEEADVTRLIDSVQYLHRLEGGRVAMVGISYGGSFCLLAADDPRLAGTVAFVGAFGSFDRLIDVVQGVTTGATVYRGRVVPWRTIPQARTIVDHAAEGLVSPGDRTPLAAALASDDPAGLSPTALPVYRLLTNRDPRRVASLARALPPPFRASLARFSPAAHLRRLRAPLFILQSLNDPATPPTEAYLLRDEVPGARLIVLRTFQHVSPPGRGTPLLRRAADLFGGWEFASWVLAAQE